MADLSDVEQGLVAALAQILYPSGSQNASLVGAKCRVYRGWPLPAALDADLAAGTLNVTVFTQDVETNVTKYDESWQDLPVTVAGLTATVSGKTITLAGAPSVPLNVAAVIDGTPFVYPVQANDSLTRVATGLTAIVNETTPATNTGAVITVPGAVKIAARVGGTGNSIREIKRQKRNFLLSFWSPTPTLRDQAAAPCDQGLAKTNYLSLPDGSLGRLRYVRSMVSDRVENEKLYRRDLVYSVEYGTTDTMTAPTVVTQKVNLSGGLDPSAPLIKTFSF